MNSINDVTFIIPVYKLDEYKQRNLKYVLPFIIDTGCKVIIAEQSDTKTSNISDLLKEYSSIQHVFYETQEKQFHKAGIINYAVKNHVDTTYAWVNDVDYYMRFKNVFGVAWTSKFIQPYDISKKLNERDTETLVSDEQLNIDFTDTRAKYISSYSSLSFIFNVEEFLSIGGMDESIYGCNQDDIVFVNRVKEKHSVQIIEFKGIHLWHPTENETPSFRLKRKDMAVITCHFNWCGFESPVKNLNRFLNQMEAMDIPVYGVELSHTDEFVTKNRKNWKHITVKKENVCFQKEACINLVEKIVPKKYTKIAWIDCDLYFTNQNWYEDTSKKLEKYKIVQMYSSYYFTNKYGATVQVIPSMMTQGVSTAPELDKAITYTGVPGGALAARRELWSIGGGLFPYSYMGGGDSVLIYTIIDVFENKQIRNAAGNIGDKSFHQFSIWKNMVQSYISRKELSYIDGGIIHEWHGDRDQRGYVSRNILYTEIDWEKNIKLNDDGIIEISNMPEKFYNDILAYFKARNEDGLFTKSNKSRLS